MTFDMMWCDGRWLLSAGDEYCVYAACSSFLRFLYNPKLLLPYAASIFKMDSSRTMDDTFIMRWAARLD